MGSGSQQVVSADFNRDGLPDVAAAHRNQVNEYPGPAVVVYYGRDDGTFSGIRDEETEVYSVGIDVHISPHSLATGHFDDDGLIDLVVAIGSSELTVLRGRADRGFDIAGSHSCSGATMVLTGDFDADGRSDVVTSSHVCRGLGDGAFAPCEAIAAYTDSYGTRAVADLNGDGVDDLAGTELSYLWLRYGAEGTGLGERMTRPVPAARYAPVLATGDFNGDGHNDVAVHGSECYWPIFWAGCSWLSLFYGEDGGFAARQDYPGFSFRNWSFFLSAADLNGDGRDDLTAHWHGYETCCGAIPDGFTILWGWVGNNVPTDRASFLSGVGDHTSADLDRDGLPELLSYGGMILDYKRLEAKMAVRTNIDFGDNLQGIATADLDDDGVLDLAVVDEDARAVYVLWGDGTGEFVLDTTSYPTPGSPTAVADFDGDDLPDLAVRIGQTAVHILHQTGPRTFGMPEDYAFVDTVNHTNMGNGMAAADFDRNGCMDLTAGGVIRYGQQTVDRCTLGTEQEIEIRGDPLAVDLDQDGWIDLAGRFYGCSGASPCLGAVFNQTGEGFGAPQGGCIDITYCGHGLDTGDFNSDGTPDLVTFASDADTARNSWIVVLHGNPAGGLAEETVDYGPYYLGRQMYLQSLVSADFNRDGFDDVSLGSLYVVLGQEGGGFRQEIRFGSKHSASSDLVTGDFNNDGRLDIASTFGVPGLVEVFLNQDTHKAVGDLAIVSVAAPASGVVGHPIEVSWTGRNKRARALYAKWTDGVYLSVDEHWDIFDRYLGKAEYVGNLDGEEEYTQVATVPLPAVAVGDYYLLVRADIYDDIEEAAGEVDNVTSTPITVDVPILSVCPANAPPEKCPGLDDEFPGIPSMRQYKVDAVEGEDLLYARRRSRDGDHRTLHPP